MKLSGRMTGHRFSCEIFCSESDYSIRLEKYIVNHKTYVFVVVYEPYVFVAMVKTGVVQATPVTL